MALVNFADLDFDQIKVSIKDYLRSNSNFTDYDFEGSNLSVIVDTLAYNTYITSYNTNMVTNEVFIDSATLRENVVSLARNIGYVPRSRKSARAKVSFFVDTSNFTNAPASLILKAGVVATTDPFFVNKVILFQFLPILPFLLLIILQNLTILRFMKVLELQKPLQLALLPQISDLFLIMPVLTLVCLP